MHRQITDAPDHLVVDHIDHNGLNNQKKNLRVFILGGMLKLNQSNYLSSDEDIRFALYVNTGRPVARGNLIQERGAQKG